MTLATVPVVLVCARCGTHWHGAYRGPVSVEDGREVANLTATLDTRLMMSFELDRHAGPIVTHFLTAGG